MSLFIYQPSTGTILPLTGKEYVCDTDLISAVALSAIENRQEVSESQHKGHRLDTTSVRHLFFEA